MNTGLSQQFINAFFVVAIAAVLGVLGVTILALPLGLIGGFVLIKEMTKQLFK